MMGTWLHVAVEVEKCMQGFDEKSDGKKQLGKSRRRWEDNITNYMKDIGL
jgi:hypothetical protein